MNVAALAKPRHVGDTMRRIQSSSSWTVVMERARSLPTRPCRLVWLNERTFMYVHGSVFKVVVPILSTLLRTLQKDMTEEQRTIGI